MQIYEAATTDLVRSQYRDPLLRHLTRTIVALARQFGPDPAGLRVIDIGCGVGRSSLALARAGYTVVGVDPSARAIEVARSEAAEAGTASGIAASAPPEFFVGDATAAAPEEWRGAFDIAVCSEVIEHVEAPERVIAYAWSVLKPSGILILTTPHDRALWTIMDDYAGHVTRFTPAEISALLADFDLIELGTEGFPFQRLVMRAYDRMLARRGGEHRFDSFGGSPIYHVYTALMPYLLNLDHRLRGLRRGTTLVAVGQRR
jgi:ubiquinone biosynthesis O-methyltransferase